MQRIALGIIFLYQRFISPYKGFSCAYHAYTGHASCSAHGFRAINRYGLQLGMELIKRRLQKCGETYRQHLKICDHQTTKVMSHRRQAGHLDCSFDVGACDVSDIGSCACDGVSNCGSLPCDFDFGEKRRRKKNEEKYVEIGPNSLPKN